MNAQPVLELADVRRTYPGSPPVDSVAGVSLAVFPGELLAVVGPSGSGKSTLVHLMAALERPTSGTVRVAGHDVGRLSDGELSGLRAHHLGVIFQQFFLLDALSAVQNVAAGLLYCGIAARQRQERAIDALHLVGLGHRLSHRPGQLSGGEQQRVAIARALVGRPAVMLADEPTGNLDQATGREIVALLRELNAAEGTALVVITHDQAVASAMDRQVELRDGRIVAERRNQPAAEQRNPVTLERPAR
ncbi:MAG: putative transport system ATP-binding protein [Streptosporangiaceae bacterium]|jgi:putative ABC transport system ATP-binding protein|nr:putative transport system ATP-binding protein [Streptosporangiaceae bacterium]